MRLVYRLTFPAKEIALISPYLHESDSYLEFATLGEVSTELFAHFWAYGPDRELLGDRLATDRVVTEISQLARCSDRIRYWVEWDMNADAVASLEELATALHNQDVMVLFGRVTPTEWHCFLQFPSRESVIHFYTESPISQSRLDQQTDLELKNHQS